MLIQHYWAGGGTRKFDPETGAVSMRRHSGEPSVWGIAWKQRGRWFVLWHDGDSLILQRGKLRWRLDNSVSLDVTGGVRRCFRLRKEGRTEFEFSYWFGGAIWAHFDPAYDALDEETDDFFVYVTSMWEYWKDLSGDEFLANLAKYD